MELILKIDK